MTTQPDAEPVVDVEPYPSILRRAAELGCAMPDGIVLLPENFCQAEDPGSFLMRSEAATVRKVLRAAGLSVGELSHPDLRPGYVHNRSADWISPTLFITASLISDSPMLVNVALNVLSDYVSDLFRGRDGGRVKLQVIVEKTPEGTCKKLHYEGDAAGLRHLASAVKRLADD